MIHNFHGRVPSQLAPVQDSYEEGRLSVGGEERDAGAKSATRFDASFYLSELAIC